MHQSEIRLSYIYMINFQNNNIVASRMVSKIVNVYSVSPSESDSAAESVLPLVYFDMIWLQDPPTETLYFYALQCSESCFLETIAVKLKHSLSIALNHFLPLASKIIFPLTSGAMPVSRYAAGDSVSLTIATSDAADFTNLTANHSYKDAAQFHSFVPPLPPAVDSSDDVRFSVVAIQATLFPNQGICIGFTHHHAICDATTLFGFVRSWASIHKSNGDDQRLDRNLLPFYGRDSVQDASQLSAGVWEHVKTRRPAVSRTTLTSLKKVRASFILSDAQIKKLKSLGRGRSAFVAVCAHLWSCLAKSAADEEVDDDEVEYFSFPVNCRARLNPVLPDTYFGNCLVFRRANSTHGRLKGEEGFVAAAAAIDAAVAAGGALDGFKKQVMRLSGKRVTMVAGSMRIDPYGADYGWGRAIKFECIHTDFDGAISLFKARDGGVEIGLSLPNAEIMDAFAAVFNKELDTTTLSIAASKL